MLELVYVADTYCGWCYGFGPTARDLAADERVSLTVKHGALFVGDRAGTLADYPHIPGANARISQLTGVQFGADYEAVLAEGSLHMDSDDAAVGLMALRTVAGEERALEALSALQAAFYGRGLSLSESAAYEFAAEQLGLDAGAVEAARHNPDVVAAARAEQQAVLGAGVDHYPTLAVVTDRGLVEVGSPTASAAEIIERAQVLAAVKE